jgi:hypothetical protein
MAPTYAALSLVIVEFFFVELHEFDEAFAAEIGERLGTVFEIRRWRR